MFIILMNGVLVMVTPTLTLNSMLYPSRIDSVFLSQQQLYYEIALEKGKADSGRTFIYSPSQLRVHYLEMTYTLPGDLVLRGWMAMDSTRALSPLLLIIPDISEGAINYISTMKHFNERGFNVCIMDMRGQGRSDGQLYNPGLAAEDVIALVSELKKMPFIDKVAILGIRSGAGIAIKAASLSPFTADVIVLQNPPVSLSKMVKQQAVREWGDLIKFFIPSIIRSYSQKTGLNLDDFNYEMLIGELTIPQMTVVANYTSKLTVDEALEIYKASTYFRKRFFTDKESFKKPAGVDNSKQYFDKISAFINSSLPGKRQKTRFRKLVMN